MLLKLGSIGHVGIEDRGVYDFFGHEVFCKKSQTLNIIPTCLGIVYGFSCLFLIIAKQSSRNTILDVCFSDIVGKEEFQFVVSFCEGLRQ